MFKNRKEHKAIIEIAVFLCGLENFYRMLTTLSLSFSSLATNCSKMSKFLFFFLIVSTITSATVAAIANLSTKLREIKSSKLTTAYTEYTVYAPSGEPALYEFTATCGYEELVSVASAYVDGMAQKYGGKNYCTNMGGGSSFANVYGYDADLTVVVPVDYSVDDCADAGTPNVANAFPYPTTGKCTSADIDSSATSMDFDEGFYPNEVGRPRLEIAKYLDAGCGQKTVVYYIATEVCISGRAFTVGNDNLGDIDVTLGYKFHDDGSKRKSYK